MPKTQIQRLMQLDRLFATHERHVERNRAEMTYRRKPQMMYFFRSAMLYRRKANLIEAICRTITEES